MYRINFGDLDNVELKEGWGLVPDPMGRCLAQKWWKSFRKENYWFPSYDDDAFWPTRVPGAFNRIHSELEYYEGMVVYLNHFPARLPEAGEKVFLQFEGVSERARVFLNGIYLGEQDGGYVPFTFEIGSVLQAENRLLVIVDNRRTDYSVPSDLHDWQHEGGIIRPVRLYYRPTVFLRDCAVWTELEEQQLKLTFRVLIEAPVRERFNVHLTLREPDGGAILWQGTVSGRAGSWSERQVVLPRSAVRLWSCADPFRYRLEARLGRDHWCDEVGLREIRTAGREILLNGEPLILRGVAAWAEDPDRGLFSLGEQAAERTINQLRELNCNFARAGHRPNSREFIRACDRAGILLWVEVPAYWLPDMQRPGRSRIALQALAETIRFFRNRPSVIIWSVGNECLFRARSEVQSNLAYFVEAAELVHELDPSRLAAYTGGMEGPGKEDKIAEICPPEIVEKLDVIGINSYSGINDGAEPGRPDEFPDQYAKVELASDWGKPVVMAEAGIDAVLGERGFDFGEERQADYHRKLQQFFAETVARGWLQGLSIFVLNDFRTPLKRGRFQRGFNRKGLLDEHGTPKPAHAVVRDGFARLADLGSSRV